MYRVKARQASHPGAGLARTYTVSSTVDERYSRSSMTAGIGGDQFHGRVWALFQSLGEHQMP